MHYKKVTPADVKRMVKESGRSYLAEIESDADGRHGIWWTESHVALKLSGQRYDSPLVKFLDILNIDKTTPCAIDSELHPDTSTHATIPNIGQVLPHRNDFGTEVECRRIKGGRLIVQNERNGDLVMFGAGALSMGERNGTDVYVQQRYVDLCEQTVGVVAWHGRTPLKLIVGTDVDGNLVACIMPVRVD